MGTASDRVFRVVGWMEWYRQLGEKGDESMQKLLVAVMVAGAMVMTLGAGAAAQESAATIRTYQGISYMVADPSLEVFYTIGELKESPSTTPTSGMTFGTTINLGMPSTGGGEQVSSPVAGGTKEERLLRGHSQASAITVSKDGVETRIPWEQVRTMSFARTPDPAAGLPPYISQYRYSASVTLVDGTRVEADYVNLGVTFLRGTTPAGRVDIPWQEVEGITFNR